MGLHHHARRRALDGEVPPATDWLGVILESNPDWGTRFTETSGVTSADEIGSSDLTWSGGLSDFTFASQVPTEPGNPAVNPTGGQQGITASPPNAITELTILCVIARSNDPGANKVISGVWDGGGLDAYRQWVLWRSAFGAGVGLVVRDQTDANLYESPLATAVYANVKHVLHGTWSAAEAKVRLFLDGSEIGTGTATPGMTQIFQGGVGNKLVVNNFGERGPNTGFQWNGKIDDHFGWSTRVSDAEILRQAQAGGYAP